MLALEEKWIWDFWFARDGADWHVFFLQADKSLGDPDLRHWNVSIGHAVSSDLVNWTHLGACFAPAPSPAWDDCTTWTGSVLQDENAKWHLFYTGTCKAEDGLKQRIGHATSDDLHNWRRAGNNPVLDIDTTIYEEFEKSRWHDRAFRDPHVIRDPAGDGWLMFFTARANGFAEANAAGAIGLATSPDLENWELQPPVYAGGHFGQLEVPQVLEIGGKWYCLFCTTPPYWSKDYAANYGRDPDGGTHYLVADDPRGPWTPAKGTFLDGSAHSGRYSGKIIVTDSGPVYMAFENTAIDGSFIGRVCDPVPVAVLSDGALFLEEDAEKAATAS